MKYVSVFIYLITIIVINMFFSQMFVQTIFNRIPAISFFMEFIFVYTCYLQRCFGYKVLYVVLIGSLLCLMFADKNIHIGLTLAFIVSEFVACHIYAVSKKQFHQRILISSIVAGVLDTLLFLVFCGMFDLFIMLSIIFNRILIAVMIWAIYEFRIIDNLNYDSRL